MFDSQVTNALNDEPDVRGWHVLTHDSCRLGEVVDLFVDVEAMAVRYIEVELDRDALRLPGTRRILVPPDGVLLNDDEEIVRLDASAIEISATPAYDPRAFSQADYPVLLQRYGRTLSRVQAVTPGAGRHRMSGRIEFADGSADSTS